MLNHFSNAELLVWGFLFMIALILAVAAYLDFGPLKAYRVDTGARRSKEEFLVRSRGKVI